MLSQMEESLTTKYQQGESLKNMIEATSMEELSVDQLAQQLNVNKEDIDFGQINQLLNTSTVSNDTQEKLLKLKQELTPESVESLANNTVNKGRYKLKELKETQEGVKELVIQDKLDIKDRMFWELDLGLAKNDMSLMNISPLLGYQLSERFSLGVGPTWQRIANARQDGQQMSGRLMARVGVIKNVFSLQVENVTSLTSSLPEVNIGESAQLFGGRFQLPEVKGKQMNFTLLRNLSN